MDRLRKCATLACAGLVLLAGSAMAGPATDEAKARIAELVTLVDYGQDVGEIRFFEMKAGETVTLPFEADASAEYYINGSCDEDCVNFDLVVTDADGTVPAAGAVE